MAHQWEYSQTQGKIDIKTRLTGWRLRLSFSLQWLFWPRTAVHRSFWCFHGSVLLWRVWTEEERFLTAVDISRWQLILDCSSRRDDNTQVSCCCVSENLKDWSTCPGEMICEALLVLPQWWKAQWHDWLCRYQSRRLWNFAVLMKQKVSYGCKQIIQTLSSDKKNITPESWSGITPVWRSREEKKIPTYLFHTMNSFSPGPDS